MKQPKNLGLVTEQEVESLTMIQVLIRVVGSIVIIAGLCFLARHQIADFFTPHPAPAAATHNTK
jgi:hypothetical protein